MVYGQKYGTNPTAPSFPGGLLNTSVMKEILNFHMKGRNMEDGKIPACIHTGKESLLSSPSLSRRCLVVDEVSNGQ
jgi:hypothetical protein